MPHQLWPEFTALVICTGIVGATRELLDDSIARPDRIDARSRRAKSMITCQSG